MGNRTIIDVSTGTITVVPTTPEEDAEVVTNTAIEQAEQTQAIENAKDVTKFPKELKVLALWVGDLNGLTPAQVKSQIKAKWESLP